MLIIQIYGVYFLDSFKKFIDSHAFYKQDVLVPDFGLRELSWDNTSTLKGFDKIEHEGVLAVIVRFSNNFLENLVKNIDNEYFGNFEAVIPHICLKYNFSIATFNLNGICITERNNIIKLLEEDILKNNKEYIENKIYHPIKL